MNIVGEISVWGGERSREERNCFRTCLNWLSTSTYIRLRMLNQDFLQTGAGWLRVPKFQILLQTKVFHMIRHNWKGILNYKGDTDIEYFHDYY